jgi:hypothetical protein
MNDIAERLREWNPVNCHLLVVQAADYIDHLEELWDQERSANAEMERLLEVVRARLTEAERLLRDARERLADINQTCLACQIEAFLAKPWLESWRGFEITYAEEP